MGLHNPSRDLALGKCELAELRDGPVLSFCTWVVTCKHWQHALVDFAALWAFIFVLNFSSGCKGLASQHGFFLELLGRIGRFVGALHEVVFLKLENGP